MFKLIFFFLTKIVTDMQFEMNHNKNYNVVTFTNFNISKVAAKEKLFELFRRVGGDNPQYELEWIFPKTIYKHNIAEIIRNTCFVCGGLMQDGVAFQNHKITVSSYDNAAETYCGEVEHPDFTQLKTIKVRKCKSCGHSHT